MLARYGRGIVHLVGTRQCSRHHVTIGREDTPMKVSRDSRLMRFLDWSLGLRKSQLQTTAEEMYEHCSKVDVAQFIEVCKIPDTFQSFFTIHLLHFWMCLVRLKQEGTEGKQVINMMNKLFWDDIGHRIDIMARSGAHIGVETRKKLASQFYGIILSYDEAILSHDMVLAAVIWKNMLASNEAKENVLGLAVLVEYVRKQVNHLDKISSHSILEEGNITWLPLKSDQL